MWQLKMAQCLTGGRYNPAAWGGLFTLRECYEDNLDVWFFFFPVWAWRGLARLLRGEDKDGIHNLKSSWVELRCIYSFFVYGPAAFKLHVPKDFNKN